MAAALPDFALALVFLAALMAPARIGEDTTSQLEVLIAIEFGVVVSAAMLGLVLGSRMATGSIILSATALAILYSLLVWGIADAFGVTWPLWAYWGLTLNRLLAVLLAPREQRARVNRNSWAAGYFIYLSLALLFLPSYVIINLLTDADAGRFLLAFGFLYFLLTALSELSGYRWADWLSRRFLRTRDLYGQEDDLDMEK